MKKLLIGLLLACAASVAYAQEPTLTFTAQTTAGAGSVVPVLTWSTQPAAQSCTASGDDAWSGTKPASGSETLAAITTSKTYRMTCNWSGQRRVTLTWTPPSTNTDGSALTDLVGYKVFLGQDRDTITTPNGSWNPYVINVPGQTTATLGPLAEGTWYFGMVSVNSAGTESDLSSIAELVVRPASVTRDTSIAVNPKPNAPTNVIAVEAEEE